MNEVLIQQWYKELCTSKKLDKLRKYFDVKKNTNRHIILIPSQLFISNWRDFDSISIISPALSYDLSENKAKYGKPQLFVNVKFENSLKSKQLIDYNTWKKVLDYLKKLTDFLPRPSEPPAYYDFFEA